MKQQGKKAKTRVLFSLSDASLEKLDALASRYNLNRSTVVELWLDSLTGNEKLKYIPDEE